MKPAQEREWEMRSARAEGTVEDIYIADGQGNIWTKIEGGGTYTPEKALKQAQKVEPGKDWKIMKRSVTYGPLTEVGTTLPDTDGKKLAGYTQEDTNNIGFLL